MACVQAHLEGGSHPLSSLCMALLVLCARAPVQCLRESSPPLPHAHAPSAGSWARGQHIAAVISLMNFLTVAPEAGTDGLGLRPALFSKCQPAHANVDLCLVLWWRQPASGHGQSESEPRAVGCHRASALLPSEGQKRWVRALRALTLVRWQPSTRVQNQTGGQQADAIKPSLHPSQSPRIDAQREHCRHE